MLKYLICDWSGVISDDMKQVYKAIMNVFKRIGLKTISFEEFKKEFTLPYMDFYKKYTNESKEKLDALFLKEINKVGEPEIYPDVKRVLDKLKSKGISLVILSSHPQQKLEKEIEDYGLQGYFVATIGSVHDKKDTIQEIMQKQGLKKEETAYLGDMTHDVEAGKKAGVRTIAISWGYEPKKKLKLAKPDHTIHRIKELESVLLT